MNEIAFLSAIIAEPDEDVHRLVYADWLEEHDQPERAEFIRLQCRLAGLPLDAPGRRDLENRETDLLGRHEEEWLGPPSPHLEECTFQRGFVEEVSVSNTPGLVSVADLFARHPIRRVKWSLVSSRLAELAESPLLERLTCLDIHFSVYESMAKFKDLETLLTTPRLAGLTELSLWGDLARDACLPLLARRPGAERLAHLRLHDLTAAGAAQLINEPSLAGLSGLKLCPGENLTDGGLATLLVQPRRWKILEAVFVPLSGAGLRPLAGCGRLERLACSWPAGHRSALPLPVSLSDLHFYSRRGQKPPITALARLECLPNLRRLELDLGNEGEPCTPKETQALIELLSRLRGAVLECWLGGLHLDDLLGLPGLDRLRGLSLLRRRLTSQDFQALARCTDLRNLDTLILPDQPLSEQEVDLLAEAPVLDGLRSLDLRGMRLSGKLVAHIFRPGRLPRLRQLWLNNNGFGRAGVEALLAWGGLPRMHELFFSENRLGAEDATPLLGPGGISSLTRLGLSAYGSGQRRLTRASAQPFVDRLGERFTFFENAPLR